MLTLTTTISYWNIEKDTSSIDAMLTRNPLPYLHFPNHITSHHPIIISIIPFSPFPILSTNRCVH